MAALLLVGLSACGRNKDPGTDGVGSLQFALTVPGGITIDAMDYDVDGPTDVSGSVDLTRSRHSLEFVVGGLVEGTGYTIRLHGFDTAGDPCVSEPTPFSISTLETTLIGVKVVCTVGDGGYILADAGNGSVQIDATVVKVDNPTTTCPTIAKYGAANAEFETGTSTMITAITEPPGAAVTFTITPTDGQGAGTIMQTMSGGIFTCTHPGQVKLTVTTTAPLLNDGGSCPEVSQPLWINCEPPDCGAGETLCGAVCVNAGDDINNCGGCGVHCDAGATCQSGMCVGGNTCNPGLTKCGDDCINLQSNPGNCGACGNVCGAGMVCTGGTCQQSMCEQGFTRCGSTCVFTDGDVHNCGGCGHECAQNQTCQQGVCQDPLPPGHDVVVFNDVNPFDATGMAAPNNKTMVTNLVSFTTPGPRNAGTVVLMSRGHGSKCGGSECSAAAQGTLNATITAAGMTLQHSVVDLTVIAADVKVIFLWNPMTDYSAAEITAFKLFASEGGRTVFVGEHQGYYTDVGIGVENRFLKAMGAVMTNTGGLVDCGFHTLPAASLRPHQITTGMDSVTIACASEIIPGPNDFPLFYDTTNTKLLAGVAQVDIRP